mmetsp:Transcript_59214/g.167959  ORF Transcript_59214/g.167959 Transcript_59214/m.167959 type:complete len:89 (+) Transcript_59214:16-282(+)
MFGLMMTDARRREESNTAEGIAISFDEALVCSSAVPSSCTTQFSDGEQTSARPPNAREAQMAMFNFRVKCIGPSRSLYETSCGHLDAG